MIPVHYSEDDPILGYASTEDDALDILNECCTGIEIATSAKIVDDKWVLWGSRSDIRRRQKKNIITKNVKILTRLNVTMPIDEHDAIKNFCRKNNISIKNFVRESIRKTLEQYEITQDICSEEKLISERGSF